MAAPHMKNIPFNSLKIGDSASITKTLSDNDVKLFALMSGDKNPIHLDREYAKQSKFGRNIAHGLWGGSLISTVLGTKLPGPGSIYLHQDLDFKRPIYVDDKVTVTVTVTDLKADSKKVTLQCICTNQDNQVVISGTAIVLASDQIIDVVIPEIKDINLKQDDLF